MVPKLCCQVFRLYSISMSQIQGSGLPQTPAAGTVLGGPAGSELQSKNTNLNGNAPEGVSLQVVGEAAPVGFQYDPGMFAVGGLILAALLILVLMWVPARD
jgi:hypothetical protein